MITSPVLLSINDDDDDDDDDEMMTKVWSRRLTDYGEIRSPRY